MCWWCYTTSHQFQIHGEVHLHRNVKSQERLWLQNSTGGITPQAEQQSNATSAALGGLGVATRTSSMQWVKESGQVSTNTLLPQGNNLSLQWLHKKGNNVTKYKAPRAYKGYISEGVS